MEFEVLSDVMLCTWACIARRLRGIAQQDGNDNTLFRNVRDYTLNETA